MYAFIVGYAHVSVHAVYAWMHACMHMWDVCDLMHAYVYACVFARMDGCVCVFV